MDVWRGQVSLRKVWTRMRHAPRESAFMRAASVEAQWGSTEHLLAGLIDVTLAVNGSKDRVPRPGDRERDRIRRLQRASRFEQRQRARQAQLKSRKGGQVT